MAETIQFPDQFPDKANPDYRDVVLGYDSQSGNGISVRLETLQANSATNIIGVAHPSDSPSGAEVNGQGYDVSNTSGAEQVFTNFLTNVPDGEGGFVPVKAPDGKSGVIRKSGGSWEFVKSANKVDTSGLMEKGGYTGTGATLNEEKLDKSSIEYKKVSGTDIFDQATMLLNDVFIISTGGNGIGSGAEYKALLLPITTGQSYSFKNLRTSSTILCLFGGDVPSAEDLMSDPGAFNSQWIQNSALSKTVDGNGGFGVANSSVTWAVIQLKKNSESESVWSDFIIGLGSGVTPNVYEATGVNGSSFSAASLVDEYGNVINTNSLITESNIEGFLPSFREYNDSNNAFNPATNYVPDRINATVSPYGIASAAGWGGILLHCSPGVTSYIKGWLSARNQITIFKGDAPTKDQILEGPNSLWNSQISRYLNASKSGGDYSFTPQSDETWFFLTAKHSSESDDIWSNFMYAIGSAPVTGITGKDGIDGENIISVALKDKDGNAHIYEDLNLPDSPMKVSLDTDSDDAGAVLEYSFDGRRVKQVLAPFRKPSHDASTVLDGRGFYIDGVLVHGEGDGVAPIRCSAIADPNNATGTYGANHGYHANQLTAPNHGKQLVDVGSVWSDGAKQCIIVRIVNANSLVVWSRYDDSYITANTLTHVSGASNISTINATSRSNIQFYPVFKNRRLQIFADGRLKSNSSGSFGVDRYLSFIESYDIMDKNSVSEWLIGQVGTTTEIIEFDGEPIINYSAAYTYSPMYLGTVIANTITFLKDGIAIQDWMGVMDGKLTISENFTNLRFYVPKTKAFTWDGIPYDLTNLTDIGSHTTRTDFTPSRCDSDGILADRVLQFMDGPDDGICMAIGFIPVFDAGAGRRQNATRKALEISEALKTYMSLIDSDSINMSEKGTSFSCVGYKQYCLTNDQRTDCYIVHAPDGYYLYADWHRSGIDSISLPEYLVGKDIELIEKSSNVSLLSRSGASSLIVDVDTSGLSYGYMMAKFQK